MTIDPQELSDSDLYLQLTLTVEKWIDSILFDEGGENRFSRIVFGNGYFSNFIQLSPYFAKEQKKIGNYKWKLGCYKKIPIFINNFQNSSLVVFKNSRIKIRDNKIDMILMDKELKDGIKSYDMGDYFNFLTPFCIEDEKIHLTSKPDQSSIIETGPLDIKL
ncbi:hypothetical protein EBU71_03990 [bacterium]|nr:hypothetical protein [Candidatus Elulimicrobium humile]